MGHPCTVCFTGELHFYDQDSEYADGKDYLIDPDREDLDEIPMITGAYFISIERL